MGYIRTCCDQVGTPCMFFLILSMTSRLTASQRLLAFSITLGPVLWLLKLSLFCFVLRHFGSVRWVKNCVYIGIIVLGMVFATYTIIVTMSCGPLPGSDTASYLRGLNRKQCFAPEGLTAVSSKLGLNSNLNICHKTTAKCYRLVSQNPSIKICIKFSTRSLFRITLTFI